MLQYLGEDECSYTGLGYRSNAFALHKHMEDLLCANLMLTTGEHGGWTYSEY